MQTKAIKAVYIMLLAITFPTEILADVHTLMHYMMLFYLYYDVLLLHKGCNTVQPSKVDTTGTAAACPEYGGAAIIQGFQCTSSKCAWSGMFSTMRPHSRHLPHYTMARKASMTSDSANVMPGY